MSKRLSAKKDTSKKENGDLQKILDDERNTAKELFNKISSHVSASKASVDTGKDLAKYLLELGNTGEDLNKEYGEALKLVGALQLLVQDLNLHILNTMETQVMSPVKQYTQSLKELSSHLKKQEQPTHTVNSFLSRAKMEQLTKFYTLVMSYKQFYACGLEKMNEDVLPELKSYNDIATLMLGDSRYLAEKAKTEAPAAPVAVKAKRRLSLNITSKRNSIKLSGVSAYAGGSDSESGAIASPGVQPRASRRLVARRQTTKRRSKRSRRLSQSPVGIVFGRSLEEVCLRENRNVPRFLQGAIEQLETHFDTIGLFRIGGYKPEVKMLRQLIDSGVYCYDDLKSPHVICICIKEFLREMADAPLLPVELFDKFGNILGLHQHNRIDMFRQLISNTPYHVQGTLGYLLIFAQRMAQSAEVHKMTAANIASLLAPNILYSNEPTNVAHVTMANNIITYFIENAHEIFNKVNLSMPLFISPIDKQHFPASFVNKEEQWKSIGLLSNDVSERERLICALTVINCKQVRTGWVLVGYNDSGDIALQSYRAFGKGDEEVCIKSLSQSLEDKQVQYALVRIPIPSNDKSPAKSTSQKQQDIFVQWYGSGVGIMEKAKKRSHHSELQQILNPYHYEVYVVSRVNFTLENLLKAARPGSGTHVID